MSHRLLSSAAAALLLSACAGSSGGGASGAGGGGGPVGPPLVVAAPTTVRPATVFPAGTAVSRQLADGQRVTLTVTGPTLENPVPGQPLSAAARLVETFTVSAILSAGASETFALGQFSLHRPARPDTALSGPATVTVSGPAPRAWMLTTLQTVGQGELRWRPDPGLPSTGWSYVAETG